MGIKAVSLVLLRMRFTREADYAVRTLVELASRPVGQIVPLSQIASRQLIPLAYLKKIVHRLAATGIVSTFRGRGGGVRLEHPLKTLTLHTVITAVDGPLVLNRCLMRPGECPLDRTCPVHPVWRHIQATLIRELECVTFARLTASRPEWRPPQSGIPKKRLASPPPERLSSLPSTTGEAAQ